MPCGFSWVGYSQLDTRHCAVLLWIANNCIPLRREHFSSGFSGFDQTQNLILQKGPARANIGFLESWLDTCKSVMSNKLIIYKNNQNNLWERMLYKCKIWICTVLFLQVCDGRTVSLALIILWCLTSSAENWNSSHWLFTLEHIQKNFLLWELHAQHTGPWSRTDHYAGLSRPALLWKYWLPKQSQTL